MKAMLSQVVMRKYKYKLEKQSHVANLVVDLLPRAIDYRSLNRI